MGEGNISEVVKNSEGYGNPGFKNRILHGALKPEPRAQNPRSKGRRAPFPIHWFLFPAKKSCSYLGDGSLKSSLPQKQHESKSGRANSKRRTSVRISE